MELETAKAALRSVQKGWTRYLLTLGTIYLLFAIDLITGRQFISDEVNIELADFEVPRIAFSFTFSLLFGAFSIWAAYSTALLRSLICEELNAEQVREFSRLPEVRLWRISPIGCSKLSRAVFCLLAIQGIIVLAELALIHIFKINMPDESLMSPNLYQGIGIQCLVVLGVAVIALVGWIYPGFASILKTMRESENKNDVTNSS